MPELNLPDGFDVTDPQMYGKRVPLAEFAELRRCAPVWWNAQEPGTGGFHDGGAWVVSRHADVRDVSLRSEEFSNNVNGCVPRHEDNITAEELEVSKYVLINKDAPEHTQLRKLVARLFTPRSVEAMRAGLEERAEEIAKAAAASGTGDFVQQVASELPMQAISDLIGVPQEARRQLYEWSNQMTGYDDESMAGESRMASAQILGYAYQLAEARRDEPLDDIISRLVQANVDGEALTPEQFGFFVIMLAVAGNETTRNATTLGMMAFLTYPDQWELYKRERPRTAADEIIRWASPLTSFQRTALVDTQIAGTPIKKGQRVVLLYGSANFDESAFENPDVFDILRDPNPHLAFGGTGPHYCVGANLARMEIDLIFNKIADHMPDISKLGDPSRLASGWINGIKEFMVDYGNNASCPVEH
ncbi:UNVERIFIED_ORG: cholest-4-en-3-one 26-monooxygenase [Nocardia globerula]|uniref:Cholest-4-en-3-one 26-monooxygenase n=1 Tax=Nocardia globerula TaxID=1818 RepID=A0A652YYZ6_NOCGL|nr:cytochrome P450 [Rhodococcus globerulus]NMD58728.1 cytochrome P450 [Nocardia globerula]PVX65214.1 cholest-4-en-3-one 26-monooxygenase [Rhodococcus globerulus]